MNLTQLMTRDPVTIGPDASLADAMRAMDEHDIRHLPVMERGTLVGVISDRDLLEATGWLSAEEQAAGGRRRVRDLMHHPVTTAAPDDTVVQLSVEIMVGGIGCMPVMEGSRLVGIVTAVDLLKAYVEAAEQGRLHEDDDPPAEELMTGRIATANPAMSLEEAFEACRTRRIRHLPVMDGERLLGIVSDRDLRRARGLGLEKEAVYREAIEKETVTIEPGTRTSQAARLMLEQRISALPVVDGTRLVGLLSALDVVDQCMNSLWEIDEPPSS